MTSSADGSDDIAVADLQSCGVTESRAALAPMPSPNVGGGSACARGGVAAPAETAVLPPEKGVLQFSEVGAHLALASRNNSRRGASGQDEAATRHSPWRFGCGEFDVAEKADIAFTRHALRIDQDSLTLSPVEGDRTSQEDDLVVIHSAIFEVFRGRYACSSSSTSGGDAGLQVPTLPPPPYLVQLHCQLPSALADGGGPSPADALAVTLSLPSILDCICVTSALVHFQQRLAPLEADVARAGAARLVEARHTTEPRGGTEEDDVVAEVPAEGPTPGDAMHALPSSPLSASRPQWLGSSPRAPSLASPPMSATRSNLPGTPQLPHAVASIPEGDPKDRHASARGTPRTSDSVTARLEQELIKEIALEGVRQEREALTPPHAVPSVRDTSSAMADDVLFGPLMLQVSPTGAERGDSPATAAIAASLGVDVDRSYRLCCIRVTREGLSVVSRSETDSSLKSRFPPYWSAPWVAVLDISRVEVPAEACKPPDSHPSVAQLTTSAGGTASTLHVAFETDHQLEEFITGVSARRRLSGSAQGPAPRHRIVQATSPQQQPGLAKDPEPQTCVQFGDVAVQVPTALANLLASCQADDWEQPDPLNLTQVWVLVQPPSFRSFQLSSLCVDKLGLTLKPLVAENRLAESCKKGATSIRGDGQGGFTGYALVTEILNFPISSVVDVVEEMEFSQATADVRPEHRAVSASDTGAATDATACSATAAADPAPAQSGADQGSGAAGCSAGGAPGVGMRKPGMGARRSMPPFSRASLPQAGTGATPSLPPTPHLVGVRVKGALAGRAAHGGERMPAHMRLHAQPLPPILLFLCFAEKSEAQEFIAKMMAFKKYQITIAVRAHLSSLAAVSRRESQRKGYKLGGEDSPAGQRQSDGAVVTRMQLQVREPTVEPPPLPPRPSDMLPASRLPRMVTNEEGEVFWYIPKKNQQATSASGSPAASAGATSAADAVPRLAGPTISAKACVQPRGPKADELPPDPLSERGARSGEGAKTDVAKGAGAVTSLAAVASLAARATGRPEGGVMHAKAMVFPPAPDAEDDPVTPPAPSGRSVTAAEVPPEAALLVAAAASSSPGSVSMQADLDAVDSMLEDAMDTPAPCLRTPWPQPGLNIEGNPCDSVVSV